MKEQVHMFGKHLFTLHCVYQHHTKAWNELVTGKSPHAVALML